MKNLSFRYLICLFVVIYTFLFIPAIYAQFTIRDSFKGSSVISDIILSGVPPSYLTSGNADPVDDGWLRLTTEVKDQKGCAYVGTSFPSNQGVLLDFEYKTWRTVVDNFSSGADGFCVFFFDASATFSLGGYGGSLGYAPQMTSGTTTGLAGGYIGVGFDEYGNFSNPIEGRIGGIPGFSPNSITLRGPTTNDSTTTNAYLTSTQLQTSSSADGDTSIDYNTITATRPTDAQFYRRVKIYIVPSGSNYIITAKWRTTPTASDVTLFTYTTATPPPANLKVGFAASTGAGFNFHEIRNMLITTPGNVRVDKTVDKVNANVGDLLTYTVTVTNDTSTPINNILLSDILTDGSGSSIPIGSGYTLNSVTFNNNGNAGNTATNYPSGTTITTGLTNPFTSTLNMAGNSTATFTIIGKVNVVPPGGRIENKVAIDPSLSGITDQDLTNNTSSVLTNILDPDIDFVVEKGVNNTCADTINGNIYTILVSNIGSRPSVSGNALIVTDIIPTGLTVTSASGTGWTVANSGNTYTFTRSDSLAAIYSYPPINIVVKPPSLGTSWTNTASVSYAGTESNIINNVSRSVIINSQLEAPMVSSPIFYCKGDKTAPLTATGINLLWYTNVGEVGSSTAPVPSTATIGSTTYYVSQNNGSCESKKTPIVLVVSDLPVATIAYSSSSFCGTGIASVTQTGQIGGTYSSTSGLNIDAATGTINLSASKAGNYTVAYLFSNGTCNNTTTTNVTVNAGVTAQITTQTNSDCNESTGSVTVSALTGTAPYQFSVDGGASQPTGVFNGLSVGPHNVILEDANGCTVNVPVSIEKNCISIIKIATVIDSNNDGVKGNAGDHIQYHFTVTNTGSTTLTNVVVTDSKVTVNGGPLSTLVAGTVDSITFTSDYIVTSADLAIGSVTNQATVTGIDQNNNMVSDLSDNESNTGNNPTITIVNDMPIAMPDNLSTYEDIPIMGNLESNDKLSGDGGNICIRIIEPAHGIVVINTDGTYTYTPNVNYNGLDSFTYMIKDANGDTSTAIANISVIPMPDIIKMASKPIRNNDGTFNCFFNLKIVNETSYPIDLVQVEDNLDDVFNGTGCTFKVVGITASGQLVANGLYNGSSVTKTLVEGKSIEANRSDSILIEIRVDTHGQANPLTVFNQAVLECTITTFGKNFVINSNITRTEIPVVNLFIPDGFTPNGDTWNNNFVIIHSLELKIELEVFNRWGNSVYKSTDYKNDWDGKGTGNFLGHDLPSGTYYCIFKAIDIVTGEIVSTGVKYITLHR